MQGLRKAALLGACGVCSLMQSSTSLAQATDPQTPPPPGAAVRPAAGEAVAKSDLPANGDIVVTAQRRAESLLNIPLSIQATTGQQLQDQGIKQLSDLAFTTPGYSVSDAAGYTQIFIRGVGNVVFVGADPSVATFIDDVPRLYGSLVNNFVDVQRVEVLKGAQGGLYGRNATGGVINIVTRQPSTEALSGEARVSYGEHNTLQASAYLNVPLSDKIAFSLTGERRSHDSYIKNNTPDDPYTAAMFPSGAFLPTGPAGSFALNTPDQTATFFNSGVHNNDANNENFYAVNGKILFKPTDNMKVTIAGDYSNKNDRNGTAEYNTTPAYNLALISGTMTSFGINNTISNDFASGNPSKFTIYNANAGKATLKDYGVSGTIVLSLPGVDLTSITANRWQHSTYLAEIAASPLPFQSSLVDNKKHFFYQELRAISTNDGPFQLIAGGSYLKSYTKGDTSVYLLEPFTFFPVAQSTDRVQNWSVYAQGSYDFTDQLTLTASGRYIHETNRADFALSGSKTSLTESKFLPSATLSYKLVGSGNIYARWARGFKSGGINPVADISAFGSHPELGGIFKGESVDTYEVGVRSSLFDRKVQLTGAVFYNDYRNLQTSAHANAANQTTVILAIINAGSARTYGVEGSVNWRVSPPLTLSVNAGYLNAKYKSFENTDTTILVPFDFSHTRMINSPKFQLSLGANLDQALSSEWRFVSSTTISHSSSTLFAQSGAPGVLPDATGKSYWLANVRLGVRTANDRWGISVYANNLLNSAYQTFGNSAEGSGTQLAWGNPRVVGAEFSGKF